MRYAYAHFLGRFSGWEPVLARFAVYRALPPAQREAVIFELVHEPPGAPQWPGPYRWALDLAWTITIIGCMILVWFFLARPLAAFLVDLLGAWAAVIHPLLFVATIFGVPPLLYRMVAAPILASVHYDLVMRTIDHVLLTDAQLCLACGYDLRGSPGDTCPECGARRPQRATSDPPPSGRG